MPEKMSLSEKQLRTRLTKAYGKKYPVIAAQAGKYLQCRECGGDTHFLILHRCERDFKKYLERKVSLTEEGFYSNLKRLTTPTYMNFELRERLREGRNKKPLPPPKDGEA